MALDSISSFSFAHLPAPGHQREESRLHNGLAIDRVGKQTPPGRFPGISDEEAARVGFATDDWNTIPDVEKWWRVSWLQDHGGKTPIQLLDISEQELKTAGMRVVDWDVPSPLPALPPLATRRRRKT